LCWDTAQQQEQAIDSRLSSMTASFCLKVAFWAFVGFWNWMYFLRTCFCVALSWGLTAAGKMFLTTAAWWIGAFLWELDSNIQPYESSSHIQVRLEGAACDLRHAGPCC
jgi:hypothetical protein